MVYHQIWIAILVGIMCLFGVQALAENPRLTLDDFKQIVRISDPQITPDGTQIVVVVTRPNFEENRYENELVLVDIATREQRVLTYDRPQGRLPRWSPSGDRLAFLAADDEGTAQIYVMPMHGGDSKQITEVPNGVKYFAWRPPKGEQLAFVTTDEDTSRKSDDDNQSFEVGNNSYLTTSAPMPSHLWMVSSEGDTIYRLTSGIAGVNLFESRLPFDWVPDGKSIVFNSIPRPHRGEYVHNIIKHIDIETKRQDTLIADAPVGLVGIAPDGGSVAYLKSAGEVLYLTPEDIYLKPISGGESANLTGALDRDIGGVWMPDSQSLLLYGNDATRVRLWHQPLEGNLNKINVGPIDLIPIGARITVGPQSAIAFSGITSSQPPELYYMASIQAEPIQLTHFNSWALSREGATVQSIRWDSPDGFTANGMLYLPPDFNTTKVYPLVLFIHGGPASASTEGFSPVAHVMATKGWIVFSPNYRGSNNLGYAYQSAILEHAGEGAGRDIMAGIEAVKTKYHIEDKRIAVSGWSYGGYLTTWLAGQYQGWTAAVAGAAVTDMIDGYNLSDVNIHRKQRFNGSPWVEGKADDYREQSPITYASDIRTPTLILSTTGDERVPITNSYKLYHALKDNDVPVQFIAYPTPGHFPPDPVHRLDVFRRWIDWIETHFDQVDVSKESTVQTDQ